MEKYFVVRVGQDDDEKFYMSRKRFTFRFEQAACFMDSPEGKALAETIAKRYKGQVSEEHGYSVQYAFTLADVGEREAKSLLGEAAKICKREGWSKETLLTQVESLYNSADSAPSEQESPDADIQRIVLDTLRKVEAGQLRV